MLQKRLRAKRRANIEAIYNKIFKLTMEKSVFMANTQNVITNIVEPLMKISQTYSLLNNYVVVYQLYYIAMADKSNDYYKALVIV